MLCNICDNQKNNLELINDNNVCHDCLSCGECGEIQKEGLNLIINTKSNEPTSKMSWLHICDKCL